jgi:hypothetical protein
LLDQRQFPRSRARTDLAYQVGAVHDRADRVSEIVADAGTDRPGKLGFRHVFVSFPVPANFMASPCRIGYTAAMMQFLLEVGAIVRHRHEPEWGLGQVQSMIGGRVTVNFENRGKVVFQGADPPLELISPDHF